MFWVYAIEHRSMLVYIGMSSNPGARLSAHRRRFRNRELKQRIIATFTDREEAYQFEMRCILAALGGTTMTSIRNVVGHF